MQNLYTRQRHYHSAAKIALMLLCSAMSATAYAETAVAPEGKNSVNGGFGFQVGLSDWAPGGFKWFNEYNRGLSDYVWLNAQINLSLGNSNARNCWYDSGNLHCSGARWSGNSLEFALGPKLRFPVSKFPIIVDAKLGGFLNVLFFDGYYNNNRYNGVATGFRGGAGAHYFFFDNLAVGSEIMFNLGASIMEGEGRFYATLDFQIIGVEFRF
jgi:hypothetical protein